MILLVFTKRYHWWMLVTLERKGKLIHEPIGTMEGVVGNFSVTVYPPSVPLMGTRVAVKVESVVTHKNIVVLDAQTLISYTAAFSIIGGKSGSGDMI